MAMKPNAGFGVALILFYHMIESVIFVAVCTEDVIYKSSTFRLTSRYGSKAAVAGYGVLGLPMIALGLWGASNRSARMMRFYLWFLILSVLIDASYVLDCVVHYLPCNGVMPNPLAMRGAIIECGTSRGLLIMGLAAAASMKRICHK